MIRCRSLVFCIRVCLCARSTVVYPTRLILPYPSTPDCDRRIVWGIEVDGVGKTRGTGNVKGKL